MKPIALVTCYFQTNYGSQLQAYATQMAFDKLELENETIMIDGLVPEINKAKYRYFLSRVFDINTIKDKWATVRKLIAQKRYPEYRKNLATRNAVFKEFSASRFYLSKLYNSKKALSLCANNYAAFIVGSDQLWLPSNISADYYTLNFVPDSIPKISLATSFGVSELPRKQAKKASIFLKRLDYISVREISGQKLVKELSNRDVPVVCDPTLMFTAEDWENISTKGRFSEVPYIFVYFLGNNPEHREFVKLVKKITGLKIIQLAHCDEFIKTDVDFADETPYNIGPCEFIQLVRDAEFVFTDSFHCSVFSLLYKKNFFTFRRYRGDGKVSTNGRVYSLLSLVNLEDRLLYGNENAEKVLSTEIDFGTVHEKLGTLRNYSWKWLKDSLKDAGLYDRY